VTATRPAPGVLASTALAPPAAPASGQAKSVAKKAASREVQLQTVGCELKHQGSGQIAVLDPVLSDSLVLPLLKHALATP
jgi:hypothetical protein